MFLDFPGVSTPNRTSSCSACFVQPARGTDRQTPGTSIIFHAFDAAQKGWDNKFQRITRHQSLCVVSVTCRSHLTALAVSDDDECGYTAGYADSNDSSHDSQRCIERTTCILRPIPTDDHVAWCVCLSRSCAVQKRMGRLKSCSRWTFGDASHIVLTEARIPPCQRGEGEKISRWTCEFSDSFARWRHQHTL